MTEDPTRDVVHQHEAASAPPAVRLERALQRIRDLEAGLTWALEEGGWRLWYHAATVPPPVIDAAWGVGIPARMRSEGEMAREEQGMDTEYTAADWEELGDSSIALPASDLWELVRLLDERLHAEESESDPELHALYGRCVAVFNRAQAAQDLGKPVRYWELL